MDTKEIKKTKVRVRSLLWYYYNKYAVGEGRKSVNVVGFTGELIRLAAFKGVDLRRLVALKYGHGGR